MTTTSSTAHAARVTYPATAADAELLMLMPLLLMPLLLLLTVLLSPNQTTTIKE